MSAFRTIGVGIAWSTVGAVLGRVLVFVNVFIILAHLSPYEYGLTELSLSVFAMANVILLPGLVSTIIADLGVERARGNLARMKAIALEFYPVVALLGFLGWAALFFGSSIVAHYTGNELIDTYLKIVSFLFLTSPLRTLTTSLAAAFARFADQALYSVVEETAKFFLLIGFLSMLGLGAKGLLYSAVGAQLIALAVFLPRTLSALGLFMSAPLAGRVSFLQLFRAHRKWSLGASYVGSLGPNVRLWLIKVFLGTEAVGLFSFAYGLFSNMLALLPLSTVLTSLAPKYIDRPTDLVRLLRASIRLQVAIAVVGIVCGFIFGPALVYVFFPHYEAALPLFLLLTFTLLPGAFVTVITPVFFALREQFTLFYSNTLRVVLTLILLAPCLILFGLKGIALEVFIVATINVLERFRRLHQMVPQFRFLFSDLYTINNEERALLRMLWQKILPKTFQK